MSTQSVSDIVVGQFSQAQTYANLAQEQLTSFLSVLDGAADYTVPTIDLTWETIGAPATVAPP